MDYSPTPEETEVLKSWSWKKCNLEYLFGQHILLAPASGNERELWGEGRPALGDVQRAKIA